MAPRPHVIVFPYPVQGHLTPMMQFSIKLATYGILVTFVTTEYRLAHMLRAARWASNKSALNELTTNGEIRLVGLQDGLPDGNERDPLAIDFIKSVGNLGGELERLLERLSEDESLPPLTCIVSDSFMPWIQDVANKWSIPRAFFWTQSLAVCSSYMNMSKLVDAGYNPFAKRVKYRGELPMMTCIPGLPAMDPYDLPFNSEFDINKETIPWLREVIHHQFRRVNEAVWVIANSFEELESQVANALIKESIPKLLLMGPLSSSLMGSHAEVGTNSMDRKFRASLWEEEEEDCMQWLDTRGEASVLYISFGSVVTKSMEVMKEMAMGLLACKQPFLWAARCGWEGAKECFPAEFWEFSREEGKLTTWTPQLRVLSHPAVGGFLSHSGWNSTIESVSMGVPMLAWPCFLDQFTNCWSIAFDWKVGVEMKKADGDDGVFMEREEMERAVRALMQSEEGNLLRRRAAQLREDANRAWDSQGGRSHNSLALFVEDMFRRAQDNSHDESPL